MCGDCTKSSEEHITEVTRESAEAAAEMRYDTANVRRDKDTYSNL